MAHKFSKVLYCLARAEDSRSLDFIFRVSCFRAEFFQLRQMLALLFRMDNFRVPGENNY